MEEGDGDGIDKRAISPTEMPSGPDGTRTGASPPPGGGTATSHRDGDDSDSAERRPTAELFQELVASAVPKLKTMVRSCSEDTLALNGEIRPSSPRSDELHYSSDASESEWLSDSSWLSEDSTVPSNHGAHQPVVFDYVPSMQSQSQFVDSSPSPRSSPGVGTSARHQDRRRASKKWRQRQHAPTEGAGQAAGRGISLDVCDSLMALDDCPAITAASAVLHEREARFVRRCGQACRHFSMWRMRKENALLALLASLLRKCIEAMVSVAPLVLAALCLLYGFSLEEPDTWDRELVSIPLLNAAESGDARQVELLLNNGANIEQRNYYGLTALHRASEEGKVPVVKLLLSRGADVLSVDCDGQSALEKAAQQGQKRTVGLLARWGGDVHFRDSMGYTLLMRAAEWGWHHVMLTLLQSPRGAQEMDQRDLFDETPLLKAARNGRRQVVQTLLKHGADVTAVDKEENTALLWAVRNEWPDMIPLLLAGAALPRREMNRGLAVAVKRGLTGVAGLLLRHGADPAIRDGHGHTLLMKAAQGGHEAVTRLLLKHGGEVDALNWRQQTALMLAAERDGTLKAARLLVSRRASLNLRDRAAETALFKAVAHGNVALVRLLLKKGASPTVADKHGCQPLRRAAMEGHRELVSVLVSRQPRLSAWDLLAELSLHPEEAATLRAGFQSALAAQEWTSAPHPPALPSGSLLGWIHKATEHGSSADTEEEGAATWEAAGEWAHCEGDGECSVEAVEREEEEEVVEVLEEKGLWARLRRFGQRLRGRAEAGRGAVARWPGEGSEQHRWGSVASTTGPARKSGWGAMGMAAAAEAVGAGRSWEEWSSAGEERAGSAVQEGWALLGLRGLWQTVGAVWGWVRRGAQHLWQLAAAAVGAASHKEPSGAQRRERMEMKRWTESGQRAKEMGPWWRWRGGGMGLVRRWLGEGAAEEREAGGRRKEAPRQEAPRALSWRERLWAYTPSWLRDPAAAAADDAQPAVDSGGAREGAGPELVLRMPSETACLVERVLLPWLPFQSSSHLCAIRNHLIDYILEYGEQLHEQEMQELGIGSDALEEEEEEEEEDKGEEGGGELLVEEEGRDWGEEAEGELEYGTMPYPLDGLYLD